jgi:hypothetical protein
MLSMFIAYLMLQVCSPQDRSQDMFFIFLMGQAHRTNPEEKPLKEIFS